MVNLECEDCGQVSQVDNLPVILSGRLRVDIEDLRCAECGGKIRRTDE